MVSRILGLIGSTPWGFTALLYTAAGLLLTSIGLAGAVKIQSARLHVAQVQIEALGSEIAEQNRAVASWKAEAAKQAACAQAAAKRAEQVRTVTVERVRTIAVAPIPSTCPEAVKWGAQHAQKAVKGWEDDDL